MMHTHEASRWVVRTALLATLIVPGALLAQRGGGSAGGGGFGGSKKPDKEAFGDKKAPPGPTLTAKDFQENSIYQLYLDKKKDLKLTDAQVSAFKEADIKLRDANADKFKQLDSLRTESKAKTSGDPDAEEMARLAIARDAFRVVANDIRVSFDDAAMKATSSLDASQQKSGQELMQKYNDEMQKMLRDKAGVRAGPPAGVQVRRGGGPGER